MLVFLSEDLAVNPFLITEVSYNPAKKDVRVDLSDGTPWLLHKRSKRFFNALVKKINKALKGVTMLEVQ